MGAENSRHVEGGKPLSWQNVRLGFDYSPTDVAIKPQLLPFVQWLTHDDALALKTTLPNHRLLSKREFMAWVLHQPLSQSSNEWPLAPDIVNPLRPPVPAPQPSNRPHVMENLVHHVFESMKRTPKSPKVHAMEFLAGCVVTSRAIWSLEMKIQTLVTLFEEPVDCNRAFSTSDLVHLVLCVLHGVCRFTIGVERVWASHELDIMALATQLATECSASKASGAHACQFFTEKPSVRRFLSLFSAEELRNPFTFACRRSETSGTMLSSTYLAFVQHQRQLYEQLIGQYVSFDGRLAKRRQNAATLIQSVWRRRCSEAALQQRRREQIRQRHLSAQRLQCFVKQRQLANLLAQQAELERDAFNGGVFLTGSGACVDPQTMKSSALRLMDAFKLQNVRIAMVSVSKTFAIAVDSSRKALYQWGRCLPCVYADDRAHMRMLQPSPIQLCYEFTTPVTGLACGQSHALVLDTDGRVFSWGFNDHGQLGHGTAEVFMARTNQSYENYYDERLGRSFEYLSTPAPLVYFDGAPLQQADPIPIVQIVCGDYYSMALSQDGDVFTWGEASEGQLGHGDAHEAFKVGFVDPNLLSTAYTFLSEPEPVLALSQEHVVKIACRLNHSVALTSDYKVFEWGNWGKRTGHDRDHALVPIEIPDVPALRLQLIAVGDHHMIGHGASLWLSMGLNHRYYVATGLQSGSLDDMGAMFGQERLTCVLLDVDVDDLTEETHEATEEEDLVVRRLWNSRIARYALSLDAIGAFDYQVHQLQPTESMVSYSKLMEDHVDNRIVMLPQGKPAGIYLQLCLPTIDTCVNATAMAASIRMIEFPVVISTNASHWITKRGFGTHLFHPAMRPSNASVRMQRRLQRDPIVHMEENSVFVIELDEVPPTDDELSEHSSEWTEAILSSLLQRILEAQEAGALSVLVVLDLPHSEAFALPIDPQLTGIYLPVLMVRKQTIASFDYLVHQDQSDSATSKRTFQGVLTLVIEHVAKFFEAYALAAAVAVTTKESDVADRPSTAAAAEALQASLPSVRVFRRVDTLASRIKAAYSSGARGVVVVQDEDLDQTQQSLPPLPPLALEPFASVSTRLNDRLLAMISYRNSLEIRKHCKPSVCSSSLKIPTRRVGGLPVVQDPASELVVELSLTIRPTGSTYAWGNGDFGQLGVGDPASDVFQDGYEALTDSSYLFLSRPLAIAALGGIEIKQIVCGSAHSLALTESGRVFAWGRNLHGELGLLTHAPDQPVPRRVDGALQYEQIAAMAANDMASFFVTETTTAALYQERRKEIQRLKALVRKHHR